MCLHEVGVELPSLCLLLQEMFVTEEALATLTVDSPTGAVVQR